MLTGLPADKKDYPSDTDIIRGVIQDAITKQMSVREIRKEKVILKSCVIR